MFTEMETLDAMSYVLSKQDSSKFELDEICKSLSAFQSPFFNHLPAIS